MNHESNKSETLIVIRFNKQLSGEFYVRIRVYLATKTLYENILRCRTTEWKKAYQDIIKKLFGKWINAVLVYEVIKWRTVRLVQLLFR